MWMRRVVRHSTNRLQRVGKKDDLPLQGCRESPAPVAQALARAQPIIVAVIVLWDLSQS
jgi:hypothetical protein